MFSLAAVNRRSRWSSHRKRASGPQFRLESWGMCVCVCAREGRGGGVHVCSDAGGFGCKGTRASVASSARVFVTYSISRDLVDSIPEGRSRARRDVEFTFTAAEGRRRYLSPYTHTHTPHHHHRHHHQSNCYSSQSLLPSPPPVALLSLRPHRALSLYDWLVTIVCVYLCNPPCSCSQCMW